MRRQEEEQKQSWNFFPKTTPKRWTWTLEDPRTWVDDGEQEEEENREEWE